MQMAVGITCDRSFCFGSFLKSSWAVYSQAGGSRSLVVLYTVRGVSTLDSSVVERTSPRSTSLSLRQLRVRGGV